MTLYKWQCYTEKDVQVTVILWKGTNVTQYSSKFLHLLVEDTKGKFIVIENLNPATEYLYNVSMYDGNEHIGTKFSKSYSTNDRGRSNICTYIMLYSYYFYT